MSAREHMETESESAPGREAGRNGHKGTHHVVAIPASLVVGPHLMGVRGLIPAYRASGRVLILDLGALINKDQGRARPVA